MGHIVEEIIRNIFFFIDQAVYWLVEQSYNIIIELAGVNILSTDVMSSFASRVYTFVGIIMLFKIAISLVNYFLNPDSFNDAKTGMGSVLKRIIVSFVLVIVVPIIFNMAFDLQAIVIKSNILPNVIFGESSNAEHSENTITNGGSVISMTLFKGFFRPNQKDNYRGQDIYEADPADGTYKFSDFGALIKMSDSNNKFVYEYKLPLTTIVGGFAAWVLIMYCFDIGTRAVKLSFLQLIAPVPILSYIDPKKGEGVFKKWVSACTSSYLLLFVRLVVLYFVMYIIAELSFNDWHVFDVITGDQADISWLASVFILIGLLMFAKEAPQLISDMLGIKSSGNFTLNPLKRLGDNQYIGGIAGAGVGLAAGAAGNFQAHRALGHGNGRALRSALGGAFTGAFRGGRAGFNSKGALDQDIEKGFEASLYGSRKIAAKGDPDNTSFFGREVAKVQDKFHSKTRADQIEDKLKSYDNFTKSADDFKSKARAEVEKHKNITDAQGNVIGVHYQRSFEIKNKLEVLKSMDTSGMNSATFDAHVNEINRLSQEYEKQMLADVNAEMDKQLTAYDAGNYQDVSAVNEISTIKKELKDNSTYYAGLNINVSSGKGVQDSKKVVVKERVTVDTDPETVRARANKEYAKNSREFGRPGSNKK